MKFIVVTALAAVIYFSACDSQQRTTMRPTTTMRRSTEGQPTTTKKSSAEPSRPSAVGMSARRPTASTGSIFGNLDCGVTTASAIGGEDALMRHYPWTVTIEADYGECGGALLSREWVLTSASCIFIDGEIVADVNVEFAKPSGEQAVIRRAAAHVIKHPVFDNSWSNNRGGNFSHDFALLKLNSPVDFSDFIKPICLPDSSQCSFVENAASVDGCSKVTFAKWDGFYDNAVLQNKTFTVFSPSQCRLLWQASDVNICAGLGTEQTLTCIGDTGNAAFCEHNGRQTVVGVVSYGTVNCGAVSESFPDGYPTAFARVCKVLPWIQSTVQEHAEAATTSHSSTSRSTSEPRRPSMTTPKQSPNPVSTSRPTSNTNSIFGAKECGLAVDSLTAGGDAISRQYPWTALIASEYGECGGALLSRELVLTAAHCILQGDKIVQDVNIELAKRDPYDQGVRRKAALVIKHPAFDNSWSSNLAHDFALLKLDQPVNFTADIKPICLPDSSRCSFEENVATVDGCSEITVAGWDGVSGVSDVFSVKRPSECRRQFNVGDANICGTTNQSDTCSGNGGRPAFCQHNGRQTVIGVVSFGIANCDPSDPLAFARVCKVLPWIQTNVQAYANDEAANRNSTTIHTSTRRTIRGPPATTGRPQTNRSPAPSQAVNTSSIFGNLECGLFIDSRIGGKGSAKPQNPWMALISHDQGMCGGAVLSREWVLTTASCVSENGEIVQEVDIKFGKDRIRDENNQAVKRKAARVIAHPLFERFSYDFALVKLDQPVDFADDIKPICLPESSRCSFEENVATIDGCSSMTVAGWSVTDDDSPVLRYKKVSVFTPAECRRKLGAGDVNICAGNNTDASYTCSGDSGSPASCPHNGRQTVVGVVSFGVANCDPSYPTGFARVCKVLPWIQATVQDHANDITATQSSTTRRSATSPRRP